MCLFFRTHGEMPWPPYLGRKAGSAVSIAIVTVYSARSSAIARLADRGCLHFDSDHICRARETGNSLSALTPARRRRHLPAVRWTTSKGRNAKNTWRCPIPPAMAIIPLAHAGGRRVAVGRRWWDSGDRGPCRRGDFRARRGAVDAAGGREREGEREPAPGEHGIAP